MVGFTRAELQAGQVDWIAMTPREHIARDSRALEELRRTGSFVPFEKDLILRDGTRVPILIGGVRTCEEPLEWMCWVLNRSELRMNSMSDGTPAELLWDDHEKIA
jgi:hypothetical protein